MSNQSYIVTRHGSNKANQSMTDKMIVGSVEAENEQAAKEVAADTFTHYNNQHFSAQAGSEATEEDCQEAFEADQARALENEAFTD